MMFRSLITFGTVFGAGGTGAKKTKVRAEGGKAKAKRKGR